MTSAYLRLRAAPLVERLHLLGPRPVLELIAELAEGREELALGRLRTYSGMDPHVLGALGGCEIDRPILHGCAT